jgi:hypothetical protein
VPSSPNSNKTKINTKKSSEPKATKEHIAGASGKLATAIAQHQGTPKSDLAQAGRDIMAAVEPSGGKVDRDAIQKGLQGRAQAKIKEQIRSDEWTSEKGSEASRLQSAAEQYDLAREWKAEGGGRRSSSNVKDN